MTVQRVRETERERKREGQREGEREREEGKERKKEKREANKLTSVQSQTADGETTKAPARVPSWGEAEKVEPVEIKWR